MNSEIIVEEFRYINSRNETFEAKIIKMGKFYCWKTSHFFKPSPNAGFWYTNKKESTLEMAKSMLNVYMNSYMNNESKKNENY